MRGALKITGIVFVAVGMAVGQKAKKPETFHWSLSKAHELDYKNETLAKNTSLNAPDKKALIGAIHALIQPSMHEDLADSSDTRPSGADEERLVEERVMNTRIFVIDLDGDGIPEVIAQPSDYTTGYCGATGNCSFWIFKKSGTKYIRLYVSGALVASEMFTIEKTRTNGYFDLILAAHSSASEKFLALYKFNNGRYRAVACYDADWIDYDHGMVGLKDPIISNVACR